jgi:hypothetical protein
MADLSGSIASGGTAQVAATADVNRKALWISAPEEELWYAFGATAVSASPSFYLGMGDTAEYGPEWREMITKAISVFGATTGKKYTMFDTKG